MPQGDEDNGLQTPEMSILHSEPAMPTPNDAYDVPLTIAEASAHGMYQRVLSNWASDLLILRRQGLDQPGWRTAVEEAGEPMWRRAA